MRSHRRPERVLFLHIPKTGGCTLRDALVDRFRPHIAGIPTWVRAVNEPDPDSDEVDPELIRYLSGEAVERPEVEGPRGNLRLLQRWSEEGLDIEHARLYSDHFWFGMHEHLPQPSTYITLVRDPVARLRSTYRHRVARQGLTVSPAAWIRAGREPGFDNIQTRMLAGDTPANRRGPCTRTMLDAAQEHLLTHFAAVGVTERYDESVLVIAHALGLPALPYRRLNQSAPGIDHGPFTAALEEQLAAQNAFDLELHRFAGSRLDAALARIDVPAALRRLHRANRIHAVRTRVRVMVGPARRRVGRLRRSLRARLHR